MDNETIAVIGACVMVIVAVLGGCIALILSILKRPREIVLHDFVPTCASCANRPKVNPNIGLVKLNGRLYKILEHHDRIMDGNYDLIDVETGVIEECIPDSVVYTNIITE